MAKEDKSQKVVETYKAVATGIASVVTAIFTSKLGVAGTLIGTGLAAMTITLVSAILRAQLEKASNTISGLPGAVQGRFSTQQIRIPGKQSAEPNPIAGCSTGTNLELAFAPARHTRFPSVSPIRPEAQGASCGRFGRARSDDDRSLCHNRRRSCRR
jgi:hypothetical protein